MERKRQSETLVSKYENYREFRPSIDTSFTSVDEDFDQPEQLINHDGRFNQLYEVSHAF